MPQDDPNSQVRLRAATIVPDMQESFGQQLRALRERSPFPLASDFAERAGIALRSLQYAEADEVLPRRPTLEKVLSVVGATPDEAQHLRRLRDRCQAERDGIETRRVDTLAAARLADRLVTEVVWTLRHRRLSQRERSALRKSVGETIESVFEAAGHR